MFFSLDFYIERNVILAPPDFLNDVKMVCFFAGF